MSIQNIVFTFLLLDLKEIQKLFWKAMAAGCIVIASDIPNNREIIEDKVDGFLLDLESFDVMNIIDTLGDNFEELDRIGKNANKKAMNKFSQKNLIEKEISILSELNLFN